MPLGRFFARNYREGLLVMKKEILAKQIKLINSEHEIHYTASGNSGAITAIIKKEVKNYFLKANYYRSIDFPRNRLAHRKVSRMKEVCAIYEELEIPGLKIVDADVTKNFKPYIIYEFIEGQNISKALNKMTNTEIQRKGYEIGKYEKKLNAYKGESRYIEKIDNIQLYTEKLVRSVQRSLLNPKGFTFPIEDFYIGKIMELGTMLFDLATYFDNSQLELTHGDLSWGNVFYQKNGEIVFIDLDTCKYSHFSLSHKNITKAIFHKNPSVKRRYKSFYIGLFNGRYEDIGFPDDLNKQLLYCVIRSFFWKMKREIKSDNKDVLEVAINEFFDFFSYIRLWDKKIHVDMLKMIGSRSKNGLFLSI